jgi:S-DNA-T family DNA segregation ATPase FtsK/SpoIIIE
VFECLSNLVGLLIAGQAGGGKSVWMNQAILTMLMSMSPKELKMLLIDPKQVEFEQFSDFPHVEKVETDAEKANDLLEKLILTMEERYELFSRGKVKKIKEYNEKFKDKPVPYIVVFIDEFADLRMTNESVVQTVAMLGQKGRGAGIHLVVATQRPDAKIIDGFIKDNLPSKISFRLGSNKSYTTIFGSGIPFQLLGKGHGAMKIEGQLKEFEQFQSAAISLDNKEEEKTYQRIISYINKNGYVKTTHSSITEEVEQPTEQDPLSKLKSIIANTGNTRSRFLRDEMGIKQNVLTELLKQLVDEGWLNKLEGNKGYELIADEATLDEWRG